MVRDIADEVEADDGGGVILVTVGGRRLSRCDRSTALVKVEGSWGKVQRALTMNLGSSDSIRARSDRTLAQRSSHCNLRSRTWRALDRACRRSRSLSSEFRVVSAISIRSASAGERSFCEAAIVKATVSEEQIANI
jgi:hypothetical protein